jgi:hypothetical protein
LRAGFSGVLLDLVLAGLGSAGADKIFLIASSNLTPCNRKSFAGFGMANFLYLLAVYHFSTGIKRTKSKATKVVWSEARKIGHQARNILEKLEKMAADGNAHAKDELGWLLSNSLDEIKRQIERKSKSGELSDRLPPIKTILDFCDFSIPLLLWLSEHQPENIKKYARDKWQWPSLIHLCKREQSKYETAIPIKELGADLHLNINPSRTNGDYLFNISAWAIFCVTRFARGKDNIPHNLNWVCFQIKPQKKMKQGEFQIAAEKFLESLGKFSRANFVKWRPVFDTFLTSKFSPDKTREKFLGVELPQGLIDAWRMGMENQWHEHYYKTMTMNQDEYHKLSGFWWHLRWNYFTEPPLQDSDRPEIRKLLEHIKTEDGKWTELKDVILKRIEKLAPDS